MENVGVVMTSSMSAYLEQQLQQRFPLFKLWESPSRTQFLTRRADSVRAVVGDTKIGADSELIDSLPRLEIVASYRVDLDKCRERGIRVTNTPNVLTDDVADLALGLALETLRRICVCDAFVRSWSWRNGDFELTTKFTGKSIGILGLGRIGYTIAKRAEAFSCTISYHSRTKKQGTN